MTDNFQKKTPFFTKLKQYGQKNVAPFDVPGHKLGKIPNDLLRYTGPKIFELDSNSPIGLDHLNKPTGVIKDSEALMAEACGAERAYFITNGTTIGILAMIMTVCKAKDKIILPRNVHKSVINGLILSGAIPVFIKPNIDTNLGIANDISLNTVQEAIQENPDAKAIFVINPTYFGVVSDLKGIVQLAHDNDMSVVVDEAHGAQFYFSKSLPQAAMDSGADISALSMHKTAGSFTQSSVILCQGTRIDHHRLRASLNMLQSTSPSSLLMASLDVARKTMYFQGEKRIEKVLMLAKETRNKLNQVPGIQVMDKDYFLSNHSFGFDETKLIIKVSDLGLSGFEVYQMMRKLGNVQLELAESHIVLAVLTIGTTRQHLEKLVQGFKKLSEKYYKQRDILEKIEFEYQFPEPYTRPRDAYHAPNKVITLDEAVGEIAAEQVMIYPPGIPILIPGEIISESVINEIKFYMRKGSALQSDLDDNQIRVVDKDTWIKWEGD
ncbi:MAG: aminotransferase class I/II-fold pyridoxal phosphate-dependent enzyme, partial [Bacilli bacterium]|nr:aminotransferase class I/II-fold pyridoxal phosphate-dependent enzyme [Bacilli bacterium]